MIKIQKGQNIMIAISNLSKSYKGKKVVDNLSFSMKEGKLFALLGSNGAGKSTTIKMILNLVKRDGGEIQISDGASIGYSPETPCFPPFLTGLEVLCYYGALQRVPKKEQKENGARLLELAGLENDGTKIRHYSKGMLQRLALAQALIGDPEILILDEPCAGLDAMGRIEMLGLIGDLKKSGKTILMNSHILSDMEKVCDEGIIMQKGKVMHRFQKEDFEGGVSLEEIFVKAVGGSVR